MTEYRFIVKYYWFSINYYYEFTGIINFRSCYTRCISSVYYAFHVGHMKTYYQGAERQRAFKLLVYRFLGWQWYLFTLRWCRCNNYGLEMDFHLLNYRCRTFNVIHQRDAETKSEITNTHKFDVAGLIVLVVMLLSLNVIITKGAALGYTSLWFFGLIAIVIVAFFIFLNVAKKLDDTGFY